MVLSFFLVILWNHKLSVFAEPSYVQVPCSFSGSPVPSVFPLTSASSDIYLGYNFSSVNGTGTLIPSTIYHNAQTNTVSYDVTFPANFGVSTSMDFSSVPDTSDAWSLVMYLRCPSTFFSNSNGSATITSATLHWNGYDVPGVRPGDFWIFRSDAMPTVSFLQNLYFLENMTITFHVVQNTVGYSGSNSPTGSFQPSFTFTPFYYVGTFYSLGDGDPVTDVDIKDQTDQIVNGFDSSSGDQAADQLGQELDNYLQAEDALYDQMQYDVPEIDLQSDAQGILLASNFLQSLYVSDSFISKVITYVLSFGLILFIVGWLKKRDSG